MRFAVDWRIPWVVAGALALALVSSACAVDEATLEAPDVTIPSTVAATTTTVPQAVTTTTTEAVTTTQPQARPITGTAEVSSTELDTALGLVTITHLEGDESSLPGWFPQRSVEGFVVLEEPGHGSEGVRLWKSDDGVAWYLDNLGMTVDALGADLLVSPDGYWLFTSEPSGLYFSEDLVSWASLDVTSVSQGPIEGFRWHATPRAIVTTSGKTFVGVWLFGQPMWDLILGFDATTYDNVGAWPAFVGEGEAVYIVTGETGGEAEEVGRVSVEAFDSEVRISDARTGDILAVVETGESSLSADALVDSFEGFRTTQLGVVDWSSGTVELLDTPWGDDAQQIDIVPTTKGAAVYASTFAGDDRALSFEQYSTRDGVDWDGPSQPLFLEPPEPGDVSVGLRNGVLLAGVRNEARGRFYTSDDGVDWTSLDTPYSEGEVMPFDLGYVAWDFRNHLSISRDGLEWVEIDTSSISNDDPEFAGIGFTIAVGDTVFWVAADDRGPRDVWVVQFDG